MNIELRDYFAGQTLIALIQSTKFTGQMGTYVADAYIVADAMLKERERIKNVAIVEKPIDGSVDMHA
jgi:hypothetical protein